MIALPILALALAVLAGLTWFMANPDTELGSVMRATGSVWLGCALAFAIIAALLN